MKHSTLHVYRVAVDQAIQGDTPERLWTYRIYDRHAKGYAPRGLLASDRNFATSDDAISAGFQAALANRRCIVSWMFEHVPASVESSP